MLFFYIIFFVFLFENVFQQVWVLLTKKNFEVELYIDHQHSETCRLFIDKVPVTYEHGLSETFFIICHLHLSGREGTILINVLQLE